MVTYPATTPAEYLDRLEPDWRRDRLLELRAAIRRAAPDWDEVIHYRMLGYGPGGNPALHLNAQKHYVGVYVGDIDKVDPDRLLIGDLDHGKGCLRFKRKNAVSDGFERFLERYVAMKRAGFDLRC